MTDKLNLFINWRPCQSHGCCTQSEGRIRHVTKGTRVGCSFEFQNSREGCPWGPIGCQRPVCVLFQSTTVIHNNSYVLLSCLPLIHNQAKIPRGVIPSDSMTFMMDLKCKREQCDDFNWCRHELGTFNLPKDTPESDRTFGTLPSDVYCLHASVNGISLCFGKY